MLYWNLKTGPWLATYAGSSGHMWQRIFPRTAQHLPATKHLLVAVAMLDERLSNPSGPALEYRSRRIINHYNTAIQRLVSGKTTELDILLSSMMAWILEIMSDNPATAKMHLDAAGRLMKRALINTSNTSTSEEYDIIHRHLPAAHKQCVGYAKTEPKQEDDGGVDSDADLIFAAVRQKNDPQSVASLAQIKGVIKEFYRQISLAQDRGVDIAQARKYRRSYEVALLKYRNGAPEPPINIIAVHWWLNMANNVLPGTDDTDIASFYDVSGMDYILDRVEGAHSSEDLEPRWQEDLDETLNLILINVIRFAKHDEHVTRARDLMRMLDQRE